MQELPKSILLGIFKDNMAEILVIIPTYNERDNITELSRAIHTACADADILFVDDNSPDGTGQIIETLKEDDPRIHLLSRKKKEGLGRAYLAGFRWALEKEYEFICEMDADFSHNPAALPAFLQKARTADLVLGTRYLNGIRVVNWPLKRLILSMGASLYVRIITGLPYSDPTGGFKCFRRAVLETIPLDKVDSNGYSFQIEMSYRAWMMGFLIKEVPITFDERRSGQSKMNYKIISEALRLVWHLGARNRFRRTPRVQHQAASIENKGNE